MGARVLAGDSLVPTTESIKMLTADYDFFNTYGIKFITGRPFSRDYGTDTSSYILNANSCENAESGLLIMPSGKKLFMVGAIQGFVIGVVNDFHFESMH
jgi:putative ABC transport system permease protein